VPGEAIRAWLGEQGISFVEDPTNADTGFTRNRIRHGLVPALAQAFPQFRETFARSARHAAQAQDLLAALAAEDLARTGEPPSIEALRSLPRARQANLHRHWLRTSHATAPSAAQLDELLDQLEACATRGHRIRLKAGAGFVLREGAHLVFRAGQGGAGP
jgi:tRNA(Ile)-lysidine synthase